LYRNLSIKKIVAAVMLLVFAISITPTIFFHDWLANHTDSVMKTFAKGKEQVGKKLYHCKCDTVVAESPFTEPATVILASTVHFFSLPKFDRKVSFSSSQHIFHSLRGPPVV
jgi:hypothetical protein